MHEEGPAVERPEELALVTLLGDIRHRVRGSCCYLRGELLPHLRHCLHRGQATADIVREATKIGLAVSALLRRSGLEQHAGWLGERRSGPLCTHVAAKGVLCARRVSLETTRGHDPSSTRTSRQPHTRIVSAGGDGNHLVAITSGTVHPGGAPSAGFITIQHAIVLVFF